METKFYGNIETLKICEMLYDVRIEVNDMMHIIVDKPDLALLVAMLEGHLRYGKTKDQVSLYQKPVDTKTWLKHRKILESGKAKVKKISWCLVEPVKNKGGKDE